MLTIALLASVGIVTLALLALRTNAAICFLALCTGQVLVTVMGADTSLVASSLSSGNQVVPRAAQVALLVLPAVACAILLRKKVKASKSLLQLIPALAVGLTAVLLVVPQLSAGFQKSVAATPVWKQIEQYQEPILLVGVVTSLMMVTLGTKSKKDEHHAKK